jgi:hypothetical protein
MTICKVSYKMVHIDEDAREDAREDRAFAVAARLEMLVETAFGFNPAAREAVRPPKVRKTPKIPLIKHAAQEAAKPASTAPETKPTGRKLLGGNPAGRQKAPKSHAMTHRGRR